MGLIRVLYVGLAVVALVWAVWRWRRVERAEDADLIVPGWETRLIWVKRAFAAVLLGVGWTGISLRWSAAELSLAFLSVSGIPPDVPAAYLTGFPVSGLILDESGVVLGWDVLGANLTIWTLVSCVLVVVLPKRGIDWLLAAAILVGGAGVLATLSLILGPL